MRVCKSLEKDNGWKREDHLSRASCKGRNARRRRKRGKDETKKWLDARLGSPKEGSSGQKEIHGFESALAPRGRGASSLCDPRQRLRTAAEAEASESRDWLPKCKSAETSLRSLPSMSCVSVFFSLHSLFFRVLRHRHPWSRGLAASAIGRGDGDWARDADTE